MSSGASALVSRLLDAILRIANVAREQEVFRGLPADLATLVPFHVSSLKGGTSYLSFRLTCPDFSDSISFPTLDSLRTA
jgi:hypothetical protein